MKAVLISIQPKWCHKIIDGEKKIEVRKTRPKIETPFKCYIYCTQSGKYKNGKSVKNIWLNRGTDRRFIGNGKVIGEFVCDYITDIKPFGFDDIAGFEKQTCLISADIVKYLNGFYGYGWHISDLKIYDKPRELSEFYVHKYDERDYCPGCAHHECPVTEYPCYDCVGDKDSRAYLYRPPQSWVYVEELQE